MTRDHGPSIKDDEAYEALREEGMGKGKVAAIANARANPDMHPSRKGGHAAPFEERTKDELYELARERGIEGRSGMSKDALIAALRGQ